MSHTIRYGAEASFEIDAGNQPVCFASPGTPLDDPAAAQGRSDRARVRRRAGALGAAAGGFGGGHPVTCPAFLRPRAGPAIAGSTGRVGGATPGTG